MTPSRAISAHRIAQTFGLRGPVAPAAIRALYEAAQASESPANDPRGAWGRLALRLAIKQAEPERLTLALQSYYTAVVRSVATALAGRHAILASPASQQSPAVAELVERLESLAATFGPPDPADTGHDWFHEFYQALFPRAVRHALGEYYTPGWLAELVLEEAGWQGDATTRRLVDPTCGSGAFLLAALRAVRRRWEQGGRQEPAGELCRRVVQNIVGYDLNPLAVLTAQANYLIALHDWIEPHESVSLPVHCRDVILGAGTNEPAETFDFVVGNPPWIAWDHLSTEYRQATMPLWERYGLFTLSASAARHGGAKKDLSMLITYACADRYLRTGGRLGFVITQTAFQSHGAGDGFRRFRLGADGPPLAVLRVHDLVAMRPFAPAANWTSLLILEKGRPTSYPVPYLKWLPAENRAPIRREYAARPADPQRPGSPWLLLPAGWSPGKELAGPSDYEAHLGANSGGANGVYWLEVIESTPAGLRVRNVVEQGKRRVERTEHGVEPELVYPLVRWGDVRRWQAKPSGHILMVQDPQTRRGIEEALLAARFPRAYSYLLHFRELLLARAAYRRYQGSGPFYAMYNVGPYTMAPVKVVWRRMDRMLRAAVVGQTEVPGAGPRPVVPQETCVLVAAATSDEAHYLCAMLNSSLSAFLARASSVDGGKGFGTPGVLDYLNIRCFDPADTRHRELAGLSSQAHEAVSIGEDPGFLEDRVDQIAAALAGIDRSQLGAIREELAEGFAGNLQSR